MKRILAVAAVAAMLPLLVSCREYKYVALSFDDGPNTVTTPKVLDVLETNGVTASFFVEGQNIDEASSASMLRAISLGCDIQNHSWSHRPMADLAPGEMSDEIDRTSALIRQYTGTEPTFFRAPFISVSDTMHEVIGLPFICGQGCDDWVPEVSAAQRAQTLLDTLQDGNIVLLHDFEGNDNTVEALKILIPELKKRGFRFVTVPQLFEKKGITPEPHSGVVWSNVLQQAQ